MLTAILLMANAIAPGQTSWGQSMPTAPPVEVPMPMTADRWHAMSEPQRGRYAQATIDAVRASPALAKCKALTTRELVPHIERNAHQNEPLMMAVAVAIYELCPE